MFGELIIMIVYLPILTLEGMDGKLFRPMALTVIFALSGSLVLSLTLIPALASLFLPRRMRGDDAPSPLYSGERDGVRGSFRVQAADPSP